jgi:hypothetical protein
MGIGSFPKSSFSGVTVRVVKPGTVVNGKDGEPIQIVQGTLAFTPSGTAICVQEDYDCLKRSIQGVENV